MSSTALINARVVDGTGAAAAEGSGVVIKGGKIHAVGPQSTLAIPDDATVLDVGGRTVMPGLIDAHTHLTYHANEYGLILQQMNETLEYNTIKAVESAGIILDTGCTAIGDGGSRGTIATSVRDAQRKGVIRGPKVVAAGPMLCGGSGIQDHTATFGYIDDAVFLGTVVNGPVEVRAAVRKQVRSGVDWVKVTASGTPGNPWISGRTQDLIYEELRTAVEEAHKFGKLVHAHAHDPDGLKDAARAGVVSLHAGEFADQEGLEILKETGCYFAATVAWLHFRMDEGYARSFLRHGDITDEDVATFIAECKDAYDAACAAIPLAYEMGVPIAIGTDAAHVFPPFDMVREMEYHQDLGMTPLDVITAATSGSAAAVGKADQWGTLEAGKDADVLVVDGRPDTDVSVLRDKDNIEMILQDGNTVKDILTAKVGA